MASSHQLSNGSRYPSTTRIPGESLSISGNYPRVQRPTF